MYSSAQSPEASALAQWLQTNEGGSSSRTKAEKRKRKPAAKPQRKKTATAPKPAAGAAAKSKPQKKKKAPAEDDSSSESDDSESDEDPSSDSDSSVDAHDAPKAGEVQVVNASLEPCRESCLGLQLITHYVRALMCKAIWTLYCIREVVGARFVQAGRSQ
jgi:hypothetical protein